MSFGVYVHIPYCLQRCAYCDFATVETSSKLSQSVPPMTYVDRVKKEIFLKAPAIGPKMIDTIYFGGGTPSAIPPSLLISVVETLKIAGFSPKADAEITLEINPGTLSPKNFEDLMKAGFNRFSVGVQTFDDNLLKMSHRKHTAQQTKETLTLLNSSHVNYSADILYSMPHQKIDGLKRDLETLLGFFPPHVSPYSLTVPEGHPFAINRAPEDEQVDMFLLLEKILKGAGLEQYEISNFAKPGSESRHNLLYWNDDEYWGVGNSSHSYMKSSPWGTRFWNPRGLEKYISQVDNLKSNTWTHIEFSEEDGEVLKENQAMTDFFHTSLRKKQGLSAERFLKKFHRRLEEFAKQQIDKNIENGLLERGPGTLGLTAKGILLSNAVFADFTYLK